MIQQSFIDMENMFELLDEGHEVRRGLSHGHVVGNLCYNYRKQEENPDIIFCFLFRPSVFVQLEI